MSEDKEFVDIRQTDKANKAFSIKNFLTGTLLIRGIIVNIGFIVWLAFLGVVYIGNRYHAERVARITDTLQKEVKDLKAESITTAARLMNLSRQSKVSEMVHSNHPDLQESVIPPYKIEQ
ncbi:MAG: hypothetical protein LBS09_08295 [Bacteroidales bacterium]|jgi:hypothetical protein|nr:hypothetical protein [Bacteroidales bacterium]